MMRKLVGGLFVTSLLVCAAVGCDSLTRPSEADVRQCVAATIGSGEISQVEFGKAITSQGGMIELGLGAPKDTKIFPVNIHRPYGGSTTVTTYWVFTDPFGTLKCTRAPDAETRIYQTPAQIAAEAEQRRLAAQQQAERERVMQEQQRAQAEEQRRQAEELRLAEERARKEAPEKLRALLATHPELDGRWGTRPSGTGGGFTLRVTSFDPTTGSVSGAMDFFGAFYGYSGTYDPPIGQGKHGHSSRVVGSVSGDTLNLTAAWTHEGFVGGASREAAHFTLRYDGLSHSLVGTWGGEGDNQTFEVWFNLK